MEERIGRINGNGKKYNKNIKLPVKDFLKNYVARGFKGMQVLIPETFLIALVL